MPVDESLVDADAPRDVVDVGVLGPALVEQGPGRVHDLALARAADGGTGKPGRSHW